MSEAIWYKKPKEFLTPDNIDKFVPLQDSHIEDQLNAVMRFVIILAILILLFRGSVYHAISAVAITALLTVIIYQHNSRKLGSIKEKMDLLDLETDEYNNRVCKTPTKSNPYMNVMMNEYTDFPKRPPACNVSSEPVKKKITKWWKENLYSDSGDIFETNTRLNKRQFYANPATTIPNDQGAFARWLYDPGQITSTSGTCRGGDGDACAARLFHYYPSV